MGHTTTPTELAKEAINALQSQIQGQVVGPADGESYEELRQVWNVMIDKKPAILVLAAAAEDVPPVLAFCREHGMELAIRGGGHSVAGKSTCEGGVVLDLQRMRQVRVQVDTQRAFVQGGALLSDLDQATAAHGLVVPAGAVSHTGVGGLTLGGGMGWLTRKWGMSVDNMVGAQVVTADGKIQYVNEGQNPDLFWAIRGGGGNFCCVTEFEFQCHPLEPEVLTGLFVFSHDEAKSILENYRDWCKDSSEDFTAAVVLRPCPPFPFVPEHVHGQNIVAIALIYSGTNASEGEAAMNRMCSFGTVLGDQVAKIPFVGWQSALDGLFGKGAYNYWKSCAFDQLSDDAFTNIIEVGGEAPPLCELLVFHIGGANNRVDPAATAFAHRDIQFVCNAHARTDDPEKVDEIIAWAREYHGLVSPFSLPSAYSNFVQDDNFPLLNAYGSNYPRLLEIKQKYDPGNMFRGNVNIVP